jgi:hypothetical protein
MTIDPIQAQRLIDDGSFQELFLEHLGWNQHKSKVRSIRVDSDQFLLKPVASFKGIQVWACNSIPSARVQRQIDREVSKLSIERLVIFHDDKSQHWRWPMSNQAGGDGPVRLVNHEYQVGRVNTALIQRLGLIEIAIDQELSLFEMLHKMHKAFDADRLTKSFYSEYTKCFMKLVVSLEGIEIPSDRDWYGSLLMNRLMFIYFMQWKGFMDGDQSYLASRLKLVRDHFGPDRFFEFYSEFLIPLFHTGLGEGRFTSENESMVQLAGNVPYINGGIFSQHELEKRNSIRVPDKAFEEIFNFFDRYQWHLDDRPTGNPNEINPDVLGYIFEQFINNKEKGAYYTKEDVTQYMTVNSVTARFLEKCIEVTGVNAWKYLADRPDRYIPISLQHGKESWELPVGEIKYQAGGHPWDSKVKEDFGLPGETYWEVYERLGRYKNLHKICEAGNVNNVSAAVTANIDLETLVVDVIDGLDSPSDITAFWEIARTFTIVDPTCGSGAFLFSAMKRMLVVQEAILQAAEAHSKTSKNHQLSEIVGGMSHHANPTYFVLKKIAQDNLYGVDIMPEACEIARLRLFLKLIAVIDRLEDIEPLPDLEFNIKSGNLLVGATRQDLAVTYARTFEAAKMVEDVANQSAHLADLWDNFEVVQELQNPRAVKAAKETLKSGIRVLRPTLDKLVFEGSLGNNQDSSFEEWCAREQQFHWFLEFPQVFQGGGFDVVIGNPPYIKKSEVSHSTEGHLTSGCPDIYAMCMERSAQLVNRSGWLSMIVMHNLCFSEDYKVLRAVLTNEFPERWVSSFGRIPACLFTNETRVRNSIFLGKRSDSQTLFTTRLHRWESDYRPHLMGLLSYSQLPSAVDNSEVWPCLGDSSLASVLWRNSGRLGMCTRTLRGVNAYDADENGYLKSHNSWALNFKTTAYNYMPIFIDIPKKLDENGTEVRQSKMSTLWFSSESERNLALTLLVGKWGFLWWMMYGDDFDVTGGLLGRFPVDFTKLDSTVVSSLNKLSIKLRAEMKANPTVKKNKGMIYNWHIPSCRNVTDVCDQIWAKVFDADDQLVNLQIEYFKTMKSIHSESEAD